MSGISFYLKDLLLQCNFVVVFVCCDKDCAFIIFIRYVSGDLMDVFPDKARSAGQLFAASQER